MTKTIENLFQYLHLSSDLLILLFFIIFYKRISKEPSLVFLTLYAFIDLALNLFGPTPTTHKNWYLYTWSTFTWFEYFVFCFVIYRNLQNASFKKGMIVLSILFILFTLIFNIKTNFKDIDSIPIGIETILVLIFSFYYLYEQMNVNTDQFIYQKFQFYIVIGMMIYLAGSFFIFLLASRASDWLIKKYWFLTNGVYFMMAIFFCIAFYIKGKKPSKALNRQFTFDLN